MNKNFVAIFVGLITLEISQGKFVKQMEGTESNDTKAKM